MRVMLKAAMCTEKTNAAVRDGTLGKTIQTILTELKPEAAYFTDSDGKRTAYIFCDISNPSQVPGLAEPWFLAFNAHIEIHVAMTMENLEAAGPALQDAAKKYGR